MNSLTGDAVVVGPATDVEVADASYSGVVPVVDVDAHILANPTLLKFGGWTKGVFQFVNLYARHSGASFRFLKVDDSMVTEQIY